MPVPIVDKNGRSTTVRKRLDAPDRASKMSKVPSPTVASPNASVPLQRTPLSAPAPLSPEQVKEFDDWYSDAMLDRSADEVSIAGYIKDLSDESKSLAFRVLQGGVVSKESLTTMLQRSHRGKSMSFAPELNVQDHSVSILHTSLRVAEKMATDDPLIVSVRSMDLVEGIERTLKGYCYSPDKVERVPVTSIETEEELASLAAVTTFIVHARREGNTGQYSRGAFNDADDRRVEGLRISNRAVDKFIRENPHEVQRVIAYAKERELGQTVRDAKVLINHLKETSDMNALGEGWL